MEDQTIQETQNNQPSTEKKQKKGCRTCFLGILIIIAIGSFLLLLTPFLLRALGLINPPANVVYGTAADIHASRQLEDIIQKSSISGIKVYVIPALGSDWQTAFIIIDPSSGFRGFENLALDATEAQVDDRKDDILKDLVSRNQTENLRIKRIVVDYRDDNGETFLTMTTTMTEVEGYLGGDISREAFYREFGVGFGDLINQVLEQINE